MSRLAALAASVPSLVVASSDGEVSSSLKTTFSSAESTATVGRTQRLKGTPSISSIVNIHSSPTV